MDFETAIRDTVTAAVTDALAEREFAGKYAGRLVLNRHEAAEVLGCSAPTIDLLTRTRGIPFVEGVVRGRGYHIDTLRAWVEENLTTH